MESEDKRQQLIEEMHAYIKAGKPLNEEKKRYLLSLACTYSLLSLTLEAIEDRPADRDRTHRFNSLQNALERHELRHPEIGKTDPVEGDRTCGYEMPMAIPPKNGENIEA